VNSLISLPCAMSHASIDKKVREERGMPEDLIRLCVGIEEYVLVPPLDLFSFFFFYLKPTSLGICES